VTAPFPHDGWFLTFHQLLLLLLRILEHWEAIVVFGVEVIRAEPLPAQIALPAVIVARPSATVRAIPPHCQPAPNAQYPRRILFSPERIRRILCMLGLRLRLLLPPLPLLLPIREVLLLAFLELLLISQVVQVQLVLRVLNLVGRHVEWLAAGPAKGNSITVAASQDNLVTCPTSPE
jgi:hypothetical protein